MTLAINLSGKVGLVVGIANEHSIAYGCGKAFYQAGAECVVTYVNDKAKPYVAPLAEMLKAPLFMPCNVQEPEQMDAVFNAITDRYGKLDFLLHSIAFAPLPDLHGRVTDSSLEGFQMAIDISCHSFIRMARQAEPLMKDGGSLLTVSYMGSGEVVEHYGIMGPVKAALESTVKYMATELGEKNIRVNALSPGAIATRAASGISHFDTLLAQSAQKAALKRTIGIDDVGNLAAYLVSDLAKNITGGVHIIDGGYAMVD